MARFEEFHQGDQISYDIIKKVTVGCNREKKHDEDKVRYHIIFKSRGGLRGLFFGHSFRSSWTPDKLVTWYLLIPFSKKKLKKSLKTRVPPPKMEESKMAAAMCQNWHFQPFWHFFEYFSLVKTCYFMFWCQGIHFWRIYKFLTFRFWEKGNYVQIQARALFNEFSHIKTDLLLKTLPVKKNHMIDEHKKFQLFSIDTLPTMFI